jgi:hypothetical protein
MPEPLPIAWIHKIFERLGIAYGSSFARKWESIENMDEVHQDWSKRLAGYQANNGAAILWALDHLPEHSAPNAMEFRMLCRAAPEPAFKALPPPPGAQPPKALVEKVAAGMAAAKSTDPKHWAWLLKGREEGGEKLTQAQRSMWRTALGVE